MSLSNPESVVRFNNGYLVSNLGSALLIEQEDGDGFISRVNEIGQGLEEKFITELDSPKGMVIIDGLLYVCDLSKVKAFNLETRELVRTYSFSKYNATLLNDITPIYKENLVFVSGTRTKAIYQLNIITGEVSKANFSGVEFQQTNGLHLDNDNEILYMVEFGGEPISAARIIRINLTNSTSSILGGSFTGQLFDGVTLVDNHLYVTDWSHRLFVLDIATSGNNTPNPILEGLSGPADIFYDEITNAIVIPNMTGGYLKFYSLN